MNYSTSWFDALGNSLGIPVFSSTNVTGGRKVTVRGGNIAKGEVIRMCTDDSETGVDTSLSTGEGSPQVTYEKLITADGAAFDHAGIFAIALEAIDDDEEGYICDFGICKANVDLTDGAKAWGTPLTVDFTTTTGNDLVEASAAVNSTGKVVALLAEEIADGDAAGVTDAWVIFSGLFPLGNVNIAGNS